MSNDNWNNQNEPQQNWDPNQQGGQQWDANQQQGWDANQQQAYDPNQQGGYQQQGWDQPQQTNYDPAAQGWDPNVATYGGAAPAAPLAHWGKRALGWLVDYLVPGIIINLIVSLLFPTQVSTTTTPGSFEQNMSTTPTLVSGLLMWAVYLGWSFMAAKTGQTPGRKLAKTQLLDENMQPPSVGKGFIRYLAHYVDSIICLVGWLFPLWDKERQTIADKLVKTKVYDISQTGPVNRA